MKGYKLIIINSMFLLLLLTVGGSTVSAVSDITYTAFDNDIKPTGEVYTVGWVSIDITHLYNILPDDNVTINSIVFENSNSYFNYIVLVKDNFSLPVDYKVQPEDYFVVKVIVQQGFVPNSYNDSMIINYIENNVTYNITFDINHKVPIYPDFNITQLNDTVNVSVGSAKYIDLLLIDNIGNIPFDVTFNVTTDNDNLTKHIDYSPRLNVYPNLDNKVTIKISIPDDFSSGQFNVTINIVNELKNETYYVLVNIVDEIPPIISSITHSIPYLSLDNIIIATVTDNVEVKDVSIDIYEQQLNSKLDIINNVTTNVTEMVINKIGSYSMNQLVGTNDYRFIIKDLNTITTIIYNVTAMDFDDNIVSMDSNFTLELLDSVNVPDTIIFDKIRYGFGSEMLGFELKYKTAIKLELIDIYPVTVNFTLLIIQPDNSERYIDQSNINKTIDFENKGNYTFKLRSESVGEVHGSIKLIVDENTHVPVNTIIFRADFVNYTVPVEHYNYSWSCGSMVCNYNDVGDIEKGKTVCKYEYVYPCLNPTDFIVGETVDNKETVKQYYQDEINNLNDMVNFRNNILIVSIIILLCLVSYNIIVNRLNKGLLVYVDN